MVKNARSDADPLLHPLSEAQQTLLAIVGDAVLATGDWPVFQYVQAKLDDRGFDCDEVLSSLPSFSHMHLRYSLVWHDHTRGEGSPVKLTVAGMAHLDTFASTVAMFLRVLAELVARRAAAPYEPGRVVITSFLGRQLVADLELDDEPLVHLLPQILNSEPATWHGVQGETSPDWAYQLNGHLRHFCGVQEANDYLIRLRAWIMPAEPTPAAQPVSPLGVVAAFDFLDAIWRLRFGKKMIYVPSAERAARLAFDVTTPDEFDNRLSALGELLKSMDVPGNSRDGTLTRLRQFLDAQLPEEAHSSVSAAIDILQAVTHLRNAGQHVDALRQAATALPALGLTFPILDHQDAWWAVQAQVRNALDRIRSEIAATLTDAHPAAHLPASHPQQPNRRTSNRRRSGPPAVGRTRAGEPSRKDSRTTRPTES